MYIYREMDESVIGCLTAENDGVFLLLQSRGVPSRGRDEY